MQEISRPNHLTLYVASDWEWVVSIQHSLLSIQSPYCFGELFISSYYLSIGGYHSYTQKKSLNTAQVFFFFPQVIFDDGSLILGVKGEVGIRRKRRKMSRKGWRAKRYLFLFT